MISERGSARLARTVLIVAGVLVALAIALGYNVWRASRVPLTATPGALEIAQAQLNAQLEQARTTESEAEKRDWNSPERLRAMIAGHAWRIEQLKGNTQATEIVAYDQQSIDRLQKRIAEMARQAAEKQAEETAPPDSATRQQE